MATAIAEAGYPCMSGRVDPLVAHVRHDDTKDLTAECDVVALCVSTDEDVMQIVTGGLLDEIRPGLGFS
jgi:3-hydroxyisobutyrate dehydrogenase-like beta-hydroxyacid dehydrogenase